MKCIMTNNTALTDAQKLTIIFRVEPGCLGPRGPEHVTDFCQYARQQLAALAANIVVWDIIPRHDKALPETQFQISHKNLSHAQAAQYLALFNMQLPALEATLQDTIAQLIDSYLEHTD